MRPLLPLLLLLACSEEQKVIYRIPIEPEVEDAPDADDGDGTDGIDDTDDTATPADCETAGSWMTVGQPFALSWCTSCHGAQLEGEARHGAPTGVDLGSLAGMQAHADRVLARVEAGTMPPGGGVPVAEIERLRRWILCGADGAEATLEGGLPSVLPVQAETLRTRVELGTEPGTVRILRNAGDILGEAIGEQVMVEELLLDGEDAWLIGWTLQQEEGALIQAASFEPPLQVLSASPTWSSETTALYEDADGSWEEEQRWSFARGPASSVDGRAPDPAPEAVIGLEEAGAEQGWHLSSHFGLTARWALDDDGAGFVIQQALDQAEGSWTGFPASPGDDWRERMVLREVIE